MAERVHRPSCETDHKVVRCDKHDAYYCATCDKWLEGKCASPHCVYCGTRPEKPSMVDLRKSG